MVPPETEDMSRALGLPAETVGDRTMTPARFNLPSGCKVRGTLQSGLDMPIADDPELDGTDAAHPAWWRGQQAGFDAAMRMIEQALVERPAGVIGNARWQALRERIHAMANLLRNA